MGNPYAPRRRGLEVDWHATQKASDAARAEEARAQEEAREQARHANPLYRDPITQVLERVTALEERVATLEAERTEAPAALAA